MRPRSFLSISDFAEKYGVYENTVYKIAKSDMGERDVVNYGINQTRINEYFFIRRKNFSRRVQAETQEMYYFFSECFSDSDIARRIYELDNWHCKASAIKMFFSRGELFLPQNDKITDYKISSTMWKTWRTLRWLSKRVFAQQKIYKDSVAKYGLAKSVSRINDRRMETAA